MDIDCCIGLYTDEACIIGLLSKLSLAQTVKSHQEQEPEQEHVEYQVLIFLTEEVPFDGSDAGLEWASAVVSKDTAQDQQQTWVAALHHQLCGVSGNNGCGHLGDGSSIKTPLLTPNSVRTPY